MGWRNLYLLSLFLGENENENENDNDNGNDNDGINYEYFTHNDDLREIENQQMQAIAAQAKQEMKRHILVLNAAATGQAAGENALHYRTMTELDNEAKNLISTLNGKYWKIRGQRRGGKKLKYRRRKTKKMGNRKHKKTMRRKGKRRNRRTKKR